MKRMGSEQETHPAGQREHPMDGLDVPGDQVMGGRGDVQAEPPQGDGQRNAGIRRKGELPALHAARGDARKDFGTPEEDGQEIDGDVIPHLLFLGTRNIPAAIPRHIIQAGIPSVPGTPAHRLGGEPVYG